MIILVAVFYLCVQHTYVRVQTQYSLQQRRRTKRYHDDMFLLFNHLCCIQTYEYYYFIIILLLLLLFYYHELLYKVKKCDNGMYRYVMFFLLIILNLICDVYHLLPSSSSWDRDCTGDDVILCVNE